MRVLLITSPYLPAQNPNIIRWKAVAKEFISKGYQLHVLTSRWSPEESDPEFGIVHRAGHHSLLDAVYTLFRKKNRRNQTGNYQASHPGIVRRLMEHITTIFWRSIYWPDGSCLFVKPALRKAESLVCTYGFDTVISVGLPFSCHLVALKLKRMYPDINWIMDIQDPFYISKEFRVNNRFLYARLNHKVETETIQLCNTAVFNNTVAMERHTRLYPEYKSKFVLIPPLLSISDFKIREGISDHDLINIAYFGNFYEQVRSPKSFLKFLSDLPDEVLSALRIHIYSDWSPFALNVFEEFPELKPHIRRYAYCSNDELASKIGEIDLLLNFGNTTEYHLPSKLVELLYFQKPVINITSRNDDISSQFLEDRIEMFELNLSSGHTGDIIHKFREFVFKPREWAGPNGSNLKEYLPASIANAYINLISRVNPEKDSDNQ